MKKVVGLKNARIKAGLSQKEFAEKLGINPRTYASYERGERDMNTATLLAICRFLDISSDELIREEPDTPPAAQCIEITAPHPEVKPKTKHTPVELDKSVLPEILRSFSSAEVDKLSSLSRDQAAEVINFVDDLLSHGRK